DRGAVALENVALVLGIGERRAGPGDDVGRRADVAERLQTLARLGAHLAWRLDRGAGGEAIERSAQRLPRLRPLGGQVALFTRVVRQVVELFAGRLDVAIALVGERGQLAPAEVIARVERF